MLRHGFWQRFFPRPGEAVPPPAPAGAPPGPYDVVQVLFVEGVPAEEYFPDHELIMIEYHPMDDVNDPNLFGQVWRGQMRFWENINDEGPSVYSSFISWYCIHCCRLYHRFTAHNILLADGETYHPLCEDDMENHFPFDLPTTTDNRARAPAPPPAAFYIADHLTVPIPGVRTGGGGGGGEPVDLWQRYFIRPCRQCRANHWYAIHGFLTDAQHYCNNDPLNRPLLVAFDYHPEHGSAHYNVHDAAAHDAQNNNHDNGAAAANGASRAGGWIGHWKWKLALNVVIVLSAMGISLLMEIRNHNIYWK